ncbi:MAG TPA: cytochrome D1, partial [Thermoanaerobaculia bacterium]|nr:cytochrome D1 [Thermoanaerobaculia bacterium]
MKYRSGWLVVTPLCVLLLGASPPTPPPSQRLVHEGIAIDLTVEPLSAERTGGLREGERARVRFRVSDAHTGAPVAGLYPGAWMDRRKDADGSATKNETDKETCRKKVQGFVGGSFLNQPALDLNVYYVLAMNQDATLSVVDPLFGFGSSKLRGMVFLRSPGEDWALAADGRSLFVSMPDSDRVAVAETEAWKVTAELETGPRPRRVVLQPDGQYLWVAYEG